MSVREDVICGGMTVDAHAIGADDVTAWLANIQQRVREAAVVTGMPASRPLEESLAGGPFALSARNTWVEWTAPAGSAFREAGLLFYYFDASMLGEGEWNIRYFLRDQIDQGISKLREIAPAGTSTASLRRLAWWAQMHMAATSGSGAAIATWLQEGTQLEPAVVRMYSVTAFADFGSGTRGPIGFWDLPITAEGKLLRGMEAPGSAPGPLYGVRLSQGVPGLQDDPAAFGRIIEAPTRELLGAALQLLARP
jgi:hypothetical protein